MPAAALKPCSKPGCAELTDRAYCLAHARERQQRLGTPDERGYDRTWDRLRLIKLLRNPMCQIGTHCSDKSILHQQATEVDHIVPIRTRPDLRLSWGNLQSACKPCHSAKTATEVNSRR